MFRSRLRAVTPILIVADLQRSIDFYREKLGFVDPNAWGEPPCFAMLNRDGFDLMLSLADDAAHVRPNGPLGTWDVYLSIADVASEMRALETAGVELAAGPRDTFYDRREIEVLDPDGHRICLAQDTSGETLHAAETWDGVLDLGARTLRLVLKLESANAGLVGRLDSPDQGAKNLLIDVVTRAGSSLRLKMSAIGAEFEGVIAEDGAQISGTWSQGGSSWPLVFRRV